MDTFNMDSFDLSDLNKEDNKDEENDEINMSEIEDLLRDVDKQEHTNQEIHQLGNTNTRCNFATKYLELRKKYKQMRDKINNMQSENEFLYNEITAKNKQIEIYKKRLQNTHTMQYQGQPVSNRHQGQYQGQSVSNTHTRQYQGQPQTNTHTRQYQGQPISNRHQGQYQGQPVSNKYQGQYPGQPVSNKYQGHVTHHQIPYRTQSTPNIGGNPKLSSNFLRQAFSDMTLPELTLGMQSHTPHWSQ